MVYFSLGGLHSARSRLKGERREARHDTALARLCDGGGLALAPPKPPQFKPRSSITNTHSKPQIHTSNQYQNALLNSAPLQLPVWCNWDLGCCSFHCSSQGRARGPREGPSHRLSLPGETSPFVSSAAAAHLASAACCCWHNFKRSGSAPLINAACNSPPPPTPLQAIMSSAFWSQACTTAFNRPQQTLLDTSYASCGVTVSWGCGC
jgi:hypothetical protein